MSKLITTIESEPINLEDQEVPQRVHYKAKMAIDDDGSDNRWHDPCWAADTSLHLPAKPNPDGKPIDAAFVPYVVVPPAIIHGVGPIVLGCQARVTFRDTVVNAVVADIGPHKKLGEGSVELARRLGIKSSPISGGDEKHEIFFELWPGTPAIVDGKKYELQASV